MTVQQAISRRGLLYVAGLVAGSATLSACTSTQKSNKAGPTTSTSDEVGSSVKALPKPTHFNESPTLKGKNLPPVEQRLPENPYVIPHKWVTRGKYGGVVNTKVVATSGMRSDYSKYEYFYGFSPLRWLNDGLDIGAGSADKWTMNADASEWTLHFRKGLRWSDGHPVTVADILFWYEDMVLPGHFAQTVPLECLSAKGTPCKMTKIDDVTLRLTYDAPQPLVDQYLASQVNGGLGFNGAAWILPKHYLKQFHPKYNKGVPKDWDSAGGLWQQKADWATNPECPTLTGYMCKSFDNNKGIVFTRNPYYYAVSKEGDQLPYTDEWRIDLVQQSEIVKLQVQQGQLDYCVGFFNGIDLADVSALSRTKDKGHYVIDLYDGGAGTATLFCLNYDYIAKDEKYGRLFRDKRFRQAISHAIDRKSIQDSQFFRTGQLTTGTLDVKSIEFRAKPDGPNIYRSWRDSYKAHDIAKAKALLADIGLKDNDHDGFVEFPDGSKLTVEIPYSADIAPTPSAVDDELVHAAKDIGLRMVRRPVTPAAFSDQWSNGVLMSRSNWAVGDGPHGALAYPQWLVPLESSRWAPLEGSYYAVTGTAKQHQEANVPPLKRHPPRMAPDTGGPIGRLTKLYKQAKVETDPMRRTQLVWKMMRIHIEDGPFFIGTVANTPLVITADTALRNSPARNNLAIHGDAGPWTVPCPAIYDPEIFYWDNPEDHTT